MNSARRDYLLLAAVCAVVSIGALIFYYHQGAILLYGDAVAHIILISDPRATEGYGGGVAQEMAQQTGGRVISVHNQNSLEKAFDIISEELRSQYVMGYTPTNQKRDGTFRKIKVEVTRPDSKVLARRGYYAPAK